MAGAAMALAAALGALSPALAQVPSTEGTFDAAVFAAAAKVQPKVVAWRRDIHEHPELGNREVRTAKLVADHLRKLGFEVRTGVAKTGVVAVLKGGKPGGVVALRADMDALPVAEQTGMPFASKVKTEYNGQTVPVMHACGHDAHVAILMGAAEVLAGMRDQIPGTVVLLFQPAEEGPPAGETGGAWLMIQDGALTNPKPDAVFGLHVAPGQPGRLAWRPGPMMAADDSYQITLKGRQTHGANPWAGIDIISMSADIVQAFNQIAARQIKVTITPTILTISTIHGGLRYNIIPEDLTMTGTLRSFDQTLRKEVMARAEKAVASISDRYGGSGEIAWGLPNPVTSNDLALTARMKPTLARAARGDIRDDIEYITGAEDFAFYQQQVPGLFYDLGIGFPPGVNHSPMFNVMDESALEVGVRAQALTALDFLQGTAPAR
ncbi:MAG: amidohydrolase [Alphaproteobacteria bacterium]|nr:amidohydrolase [Alphaproteobacteria bacterium]MBU1515203.1 amidohydrolase [Alphaproteobacteria bacterium]MBU2092333.1 amidohydrolase [Alphaproteobacteria bacterium]MBU2152927.1 amidohydrolase [Alphaproteobacteria bacterium]MBU2305758.1 amidohydrolase [Alphaproteobacteria bacterium]